MRRFWRPSQRGFERCSDVGLMSKRSGTRQSPTAVWSLGDLNSHALPSAARRNNPVGVTSTRLHRYRRRLAKGFESALHLLVEDVGVDHRGR